jgi:hypothetical protein
LFWGVVGTHKSTTIEQKEKQKAVFGNLLCCQKTCFKLMTSNPKSILCTTKDFQCDIMEITTITSIDARDF